MSSASCHPNQRKAVFAQVHSLSCFSSSLSCLGLLLYSLYFLSLYHTLKNNSVLKLSLEHSWDMNKARIPHLVMNYSMCAKYQFIQLYSTISFGLLRLCVQKSDISTSWHPLLHYDSPFFMISISSFWRPANTRQSEFNSNDMTTSNTSLVLTVCQVLGGTLSMY